MLVTHGTLVARGRHALTVGNFDGVHRGHQAMLARVVARARALNVTSGVLTFEPQPREFFAHERAASRLTRLREKLHLLAAAGVERAHVARFNARFASLGAEQFIEEVLVRGLRVAWLLVGHDFRFGAKRVGDFAMLESAAKRHGFELEAMPEVLHEGERVSSSAVRDALMAGDFARAEQLLGRRFTIAGRAAHGAKLGRSLGFPTANVVLPRRPPLGGVFVVEARGATDDGDWLPGVANVGLRPTVNALARPVLEVHLFEALDKLYGRRLEVHFLAKLRDERKYADLKLLREAIAGDVARAKEYFLHHG